jgi:hypothetical protein
MFTSAQKAIMAANSFKAALFYTFNLPSGVIKWTTMPYDYDGYEAQNFILANDKLQQSKAMTQNTTSIEMAGTISVLSAFSGSQSSSVEIKLGVYTSANNVELSTSFIGNIDALKITGEEGNARLLVELSDRITSLANKKVRSLTPHAQETNFNGDQCLKFISADNTEVFWGKEV